MYDARERMAWGEVEHYHIVYRKHTSGGQWEKRSGAYLSLEGARQGLAAEIEGHRASAIRIIGETGERIVYIEEIAS